jgi:exodeoxyribonuclease VII small subunit
MDESTLTFEQAYTLLEDIITRLEAGDLSLDESIALYEQGQKLARLCGEMLDAAELRVRQLGPDGSLEPLE